MGTGVDRAGVGKRPELGGSEVAMAEGRVVAVVIACTRRREAVRSRDV